jgi:hypothetical protein
MMERGKVLVAQPLDFAKGAGGRRALIVKLEFTDLVFNG